MQEKREHRTKQKQQQQHNQKRKEKKRRKTKTKRKYNNSIANAYDSGSIVNEILILIE